MLAMVWPIRYPMPMPGAPTPAAARPTPTSLNASVLCSSAKVSTYAAPLLFRQQPLVLLFGVDCQLDIDLREYSEYVSLKDRHKDLERVEHDRYGHGDDRGQGPEVKDKAEEDEDDKVPRQDVGVESQSERERPGELLQDLGEEHERDHDGLGRKTRGDEALEVRYHPVAPEALILGEDEGQDRQRGREGDVARHRVGAREQPDQVERQQEDEDGERVGHPLPPLLAQLPAQELAPEAVDLLHDDLVGAGPILEKPAPDEQHQECDRRPDPHKPDDLVYGEVQRSDVYGDDPGMLGRLPGVQDLMAQLLLTYPRQRNDQASTPRRSRPGPPSSALDI